MVGDNSKQSELTAKTRKLVALLAIGGGGVFGASYLAFLIHLSWMDRTIMLPLLKDHFAAIVGAPCSAFAALLIVTILRYSSGSIEIKGLGFEFKGAAGPIILWAFCFLAMVAGIKALW